MTLDERRRLVLGGVEAFLGENCLNPRDLSATSPAPEAFLAVPQHVIFAFRFQNELARVFFWGQNELAQFSSEGGFELALFFFWADFGFLLGPFRASSVSWLYRPGPTPAPLLFPLWRSRTADDARRATPLFVIHK